MWTKVKHILGQMKWSKLSLKNKLILGFFGLGTIPSLVFGVIIYYEMLNMINKRLYAFTEVELVTLAYEMERVHTIFIKLCLVIITLSICFSIGISYNFIEGIRELIGYFAKVKSGDLKFQIKSRQADEIGILIESFKEMKDELGQLIDKTYRLEISEKDAQLKALQAQISPHFLYNALDMINWSLIENGDFETSHIVIALSSILRYSIDDTKKQVAIKEEIQQINNYLLIQKSRFEERLVYTIDVPETIEDYSMPKLLLQPLVENAVIHGIENRQRRGKVQVVAWDQETHIVFEIKDNGLGIAPKQLEELKQKIAYASAIVDCHQKVHIGLANVNQRMQLTYGKGYVLDIESQVDEGTCIRLRIEKRGMEDEGISNR